MCLVEESISGLLVSGLLARRLAEVTPPDCIRLSFCLRFVEEQQVKWHWFPEVGLLGWGIKCLWVLLCRITYVYTHTHTQTLIIAVSRGTVTGEDALSLTRELNIHHAKGCLTASLSSFISYGRITSQHTSSKLQEKIYKDTCKQCLKGNIIFPSMHSLFITLIWVTGGCSLSPLLTCFCMFIR